MNYVNYGYASPEISVSRVAVRDVKRHYFRLFEDLFARQAEEQGYVPRCVHNTYIRAARHVAREKCCLTRKVIRVDGMTWHGSSTATLEKRKPVLQFLVLSFRIERDEAQGCGSNEARTDRRL